MTNDNGLESSEGANRTASTALRLAHALYEAYNSHDPERAAALYVPSATHLEVASGRCASGRLEILRGLEGFLRLFPGARWDAERTIVEGTFIAVPYRLTGTLRASLGRIEARGQQLDLRGIHVIETDGQEITSTEDYWDAATFRAQMSESRKESV